MGVVRTLFATWTSLVLASPLHAQNPEHIFCHLRRLSALTEFQWLTDGPASEQTARERDAMVSLAEAAAPEEALPHLITWRINAKAAQAALLQRAAFGHDPEGHAARRAERLVSACRALLLG